MPKVTSFITVKLNPKKVVFTFGKKMAWGPSRVRENYIQPF